MNNHAMNTQVLRADERLRNIDWPSLQKIDVPEIAANDFILVCAGFEERSIKSIIKIGESGRTDIHVGVINYRPKYPENKRTEISDLSKRFKFQIKNFVYDRENPTGFGDQLCEYTTNFDRIFIDISGMSRLLIVQTLVALLISREHSITIIYGEAKEYPPTKEEFLSSQRSNPTGALMSYLTSGIFEIAATPELSSVAMQGAAIRLVAFPSFDHGQLKNLLHELQPTYIDMIHGIPSEEENKWRTDAILELNKENLKSIHNMTEHKTCTLDYQKTLDLLLDIYDKRNMFDRIVVAPIGSKMQAVAVGLFRAVLYDIQIVYPTPQEFTQPTDHTRGVRQLYALNLPENIIKTVNPSRSDPDVERQPPE